MLFIVVNLFLLLITVLGLIILWIVWPPDSPWSPWWQVKEKDIKHSLKNLAKITSKDTVYDLGSGDGRIPIIAAKNFGANGVGIEIDYIRTFIARIKVRLLGLENKVKLHRGNFFDYKISDATIIYVYLVPRVLERIKPKLIKELKKGTKVMSYKYQFKADSKLKYVSSDKKSQTHLYKIV